MLSIDRMEHPSSTRGTRRYPRYHSNLFRGQDAWDPHTHVLLPSQTPQSFPSEGEKLWVIPDQVLFPYSLKTDTMLPSCCFSLCQTFPASDLLSVTLLGQPSTLHLATL